jgi:hypothetical protein
VVSLLPSARLAHVGDLQGPLCGYILRSTFRVIDYIPSGFEVCARCMNRIVVAAYLERRTREEQSLILELDRRRRRPPSVGVYARARTTSDPTIIAALKKGLDNLGVARELGIGERTAVRYINEAMRRAGAKNRFQYGHLIGLAERTWDATWLRLQVSGQRTSCVGAGCIHIQS